jgi:hypothetical protein
MGPMNDGLASALLGAWTLQRWVVRYSGRRLDDAPFGFDAEGLLIYAADGWMTATMCRRNRSAATPSGDGYLTYAGRWHVEGATVVHDVRWSMNPVLIGTRQLREASFASGILRLEALESDARGRSRSHEILWQRAARAGGLD